MRGYVAELLAELRGNFGDFRLALLIIGVIFILWWLHQD
jgi:hypothetical protein